MKDASTTPRLAAGSFLVFIALLAGIECVARTKLPKVPNSAEVTRNPYLSRGWAEFTAIPQGRDGSGQIYWIGNSQAYAGEVSAGAIYTGYLESGLRIAKVGGRADWQLHNWSLEGTTSIEMMLLAGRLHHQTSDLVVACIGMSDFSSFNLDRTLDGLRSDLPRVLTRLEIANVLPDAFWERHVKLEQWLTWAVWDRCATLRLREFGWSCLDQRYGGLQRGLYAPAINYHFWRLDHIKRQVRLPNPPWSRPGRYEIGYEENSRVLLREFMAQFRSIPARRHLIILCPVAWVKDDPKAEGAVIFRRHASEEAASHQLICWDKTEAIPADAFIDRIHFLPAGHRVFADLLQPQLIDYLAH